MIKKLCLFMFIFFLGFSCFGQEVINGFEKEDLPTLNDELRKINRTLNDLRGSADRGDPAAWDFTVLLFTTDNTWNELDLSTIVPKGTKEVELYVEIQDDAVNSYFGVREKGNANAYNVNTITTQVANRPIVGTLRCFVDKDRKIEYKGANLAFTTINVLVTRYWY